ncbi:microcephalin [Kryptolebias marmoratus]|uniref:Microcephalin 1 n=1 Tax=Kryptolebias marmoratus TaxID=37003 RepID=A0A3Q3GQW7_KRYMA|nr:microcephalin [Kryptolebias marmoratus]
MTSSNNSSLLKDVVAYVDVWSSDKRANYSKPYVQHLEEMGAQVSQRFNKRVTHVVFYNGHSATWRKAKSQDVRLVSLLWVKSCYDNGEHADEELFPAFNDESNPVMKNRKHRCMLPKDSPERTAENDWRMKKKLDKMMKDLPPKELLAADMSPIIIDEKNGIIYSPSLKRSDYMARRLKDMKDKHENISPTASQMSESCSPMGLKPSLGSSPTVFKFQLHDQADDGSSASVAQHASSPDKDVRRLDFDVRDDGHLEQESAKPWLSPCRNVPKQVSSILDSPSFDIQEGAQKKGFSKGKNQGTRRRTSVMTKLELGDSLKSQIQDKHEKSNIFPKQKRQSLIKSTRKSEIKKQKTPADKSFPETKSCASPNAVNSSSCLPPSATLVDSATEMSKETCLSKKTELKTPQKARLSVSALVRSFSLSSEHKNVASSFADAGDDVFEDYFSPANDKRPLLPNLPVESNLKIPFELDSVAKKRKPRRSEGCDSYGKKLKREESYGGKNLNQASDASSERLQKQDVKTSLSASKCPSVHVTQKTKRRRRSTLEFTRTSKTSGDTGKCRPASTSGQPEDIPEPEQQKPSDFTALSHTVESGGNECLVAAAFTEIPSDAEGNHNDNLSPQKMVNETKVMRTLVMTSMPTEKQHTVVQVVKALGGFSIVDRVCESTTHVVSGGHRRTLNILLGIARGCWILSFEWILWCLEQRQWIPEEPYELSDQFPAAQICRLQRHLSAGEHQQDLFQNQPAMFVSLLSQPPTQSLLELIELCGGTVCKTVRQAGICVGRYSGRRPEGCRMLSEQWILDSITNLKIRPYDDYDLE